LLVVGKLITLRKTRGHKTDTGEEATEHVLAGGYAILCSQWNSVSGFSRPSATASAGVFHAWHGTRLSIRQTSVFRESRGSITVENYLEPLQAKLRATYQLDY
jgi:hypothetical protein